MRPRTRTSIALLALAAACRTAAAQVPVVPAPNVVFILADDLGYGDVGPYGQRRIRTPALHRMAREGTRFTQFYAGSTVCAPSRSALLTGQHTGHTFIRGNRERPDGQEPLPDSVRTVADLLGRAGYVTAAFGKWGLGGADTEGSPGRHGFDEFFGYYDQRRAHFYYAEYLHHEDSARGAVRVPLPNRVRAAAPDSPGAGPAVVRGRYTHDEIADRALAFLSRHGRAQARGRESDGGRPFFLYLPFTLPHAELQAPADSYGPYVRGGRSVFPETPFAGPHYGAQVMPRATYAAMVTRLDRDVGRILDTLRALALERNTMVFFTSDNGPSAEGGGDPAFFRSAGPFRGGKRDLYEGGLRAPMLVWAPGRVPAGRTSDQPWAMWDVLPTLAELAGVPAGALPAGVDGLSMVPTLTGRGRQQQHAFLYWEFHEQGTRQAVRAGRWKGLRQPMLTGPLELYDLAADPGERHDVAARHPAVAARLMRLMAEARRPSALWRAPGERPARR